jgi:hypothetical protein
VSINQGDKMQIPFEVYGYKTDNPPHLSTAWNEQKRVVDLSHESYVFITSLTSSPWRERSRFPNADYSTIKYYWCKYGEHRVKKSKHWYSTSSGSFGTNGATKSQIFNNKKN